VLLSSSRRQDAWTSHALGEVSCPFGHASSQRSAPTAELVNLPNGLLAGTEQIAGLRLDVLVFADIGMETTTDMWAFARMARVQVCVIRLGALTCPALPALTDARPPPALPDPSPGSVLGTSDFSWDGSHRLFRELAMGLAERQRARSTASAF